ncbi:beta-lactamase family protein [Saccharomonospora piscinae]|uniref:serine hydrolase domain-containing protein n=1 Tax=Saccharomonospora piscinae TaxID=687388 RepID=UPI0011059D5E|nr:serine hydrolase domain-containing protein [Saccharomonospora piscinae]TLW94696.1 beta-lactamase family protein [Saccharomonospora piscinae]
MESVRTPVLGAALALLATTVAAVPASADTATAADVLQAGAELGVSDGYPGVIGLVRDGDDAEYVHAGQNDWFTGAPADPQSPFRIGSNTKAFVATVLLQLEAEGLLSLDDTVAEWLPGVVDTENYDGADITLRQLLNHTSGLPDHFQDLAVQARYSANLDPWGYWDRQGLVDAALAFAAPGAPGETYSYSNTNYVLAGMVVESVTGNAVSDEVRQRIIEPLGLTRTSFPTEPTMPEDAMSGHFWIGGLVIRDVTVSNVEFMGAAGAMVSTLDDLATFHRALLTGGLLPEAQLAQLKDVFPINDEGRGSGLGVIRMQTECGPAWQHTGGVLGYYTLWLASDDGERQVVAAANEMHLLSGTQGQQDVATAALDAYCAL